MEIKNNVWIIVCSHTKLTLNVTEFTEVRGTSVIQSYYRKDTISLFLRRQW